MEIFKVNSTELIEGTGVNEDVFNQLNSPEADNIFSLQRFAEPIHVRQEKASSVFLSSETQFGNGNIFYNYTLGRSANSTASSADTFSLDSYKFYVAPLTSGTSQTGSTYNLIGYSDAKGGVRLAFTASDLGVTSNTGLNLKGGNYWVGITFQSNTSGATSSYSLLSNYAASAVSASNTFVVDDASSAAFSNNATASVFSNNTSWTSIYFALGSNTSVSKTFGLGSSYSDVFSGAGTTFSLDFYDVRLTGGSNFAEQASGTYLNAYVFNTMSSTNLLTAKNNTTYVFDNVDSGETEKYTFNGVGVSLIGRGGTSQTNLVTMTTKAYATEGLQTFEDIAVSTSGVSMAFTLNDKVSELALNNATYSVRNSSGTVTFGIMSNTANQKVITLGGKGEFKLNSLASDGTVYVLDGNASATFSVGAGTYVLDLDGDSQGTMAPMTFTALSEATLSAVAGTSEVTLEGNWGLVSGTALTSLTYHMSDGAIATIGNYTFSDTAADSTAGLVSFNNASSVNIAGSFKIGSGTATYILNSDFKFSDGSTAQIGGYDFSDTSDSNAATVSFSSESNTLVLSNPMTASGKFPGFTFTLSNTGLYQINNDVFSTTSGGSSTANQFSYISTNVSYAAAHTETYFGVTNSEVTGFDLGINVTEYGTTTVDVNSAKLVGGKFYIGNTGDTPLTYTLSGDSGVSLNGAGGEISMYSNTSQLIGISSATFTVSAGTYSFFLADGGTGTTINSLKFSEVSDGSVSKLDFGAQNQVGVTGAVIIDSSTSTYGTRNIYTLNSIAGTDSAITIDNIRFSGSGVTVQNKAANAYELGGIENGGTYSITGTSTDKARTFTLVDNSKGQFNFGGIHITTSDTSISNDGSGINVVVDSAQVMASATTIASIQIANSEVAINDAGTSDPYTVIINEKGEVKGIEDIDSGATLTAVAGATYVLTTVDSATGFYTFKTSSLIGNDTTATQIFNITNDANGVKFILDTNQTVVQIEGIDNGATVSITDSTLQKSNYAFQKTYNADNSAYTRNDDGSWGNSNYLAYIAINNGKGYSYIGVESSTEMAHTTPDSIGTDVAITSTTTKFTLNESAFSGDNALVSFTFQNSGTDIFGADVSGSAVTSLFTGLQGATNVGVMVETDTANGYALSIATYSNTGVPEAITSHTQIADTVNMTLGAVPLTVFDGYVVSGTNVSLTADANNVTVSAATGSDAYISMTDSNSSIVFGATSLVNYHINDTHDLKVNKTTNGTAIATNTDVLNVTVSGGAILEDTMTVDSDIAVNGITYQLASDAETTFRVTSKSNSSDTLLISSGLLGVDGTDVSVFAKTNINVASGDTVGLVFDIASYTNASNATVVFTLTNGDAASGTKQYASVTGGTLGIAIANSEAVVFNGAIYTATSTDFAFTRSTSADIMSAGSAKGLSTAGEEYAIAPLSATYSLASGSGKTITFSSESSAFDTYHLFDVTYQGATGTLTVDAGSHFTIADAFLSGSGVNQSTFNSFSETVYTYTASTRGDLTMTLDTEGNALISASESDIVGTRELKYSDDQTATFVIDADNLSNLDSSVTEQFTYTIASGATLEFAFNSESKLAAGDIFAGSGTRVFAAGDVDKFADNDENIFKSYNSDVYTPDAGATMTLVVKSGVGTETFTAGSATFTVDSGEFHYGDSATAYTGSATFSAYFEDGVASKLSAAEATGTRTGNKLLFGKDGVEDYILLGDTYTMDEGAVITLNVTGVDAATETFTAGTGTFTGTTFHVSDKYLNGGASEEVFTYTSAVDATLKLNLKDGAATIDLGTSVGTRTDEDTLTFDFNEETYTSTGLALTFQIDGSSTSAAGDLWAASGTRTLTAAGGENDTKTFLGNVYTAASGATMTLAVKEGAGTETFTSGSATFTAAANDVFSFDFNGNNKIEANEVYTATGNGATFTVYFDEDGSGTLISASGTGTRIGSDTYTIDALGSDTYNMADDSVITLNIDGVGSATEIVTSGSGTFTGGTFHIADAYLGGEGDTVYTYTAVGDATLTLNLTEDGKETIDLGDTKGTRQTNDAEFSFALDGNAQTYTTIADTSLTFQIDSSTSAAGNLFEGSGIRALADVEENATATYEGNVYTAMAGATMTLVVESGKGTETFTAGSATFTVDSSEFTYGENTYTGSATFEAYFNDATAEDAQLTSVDGSGTRIGGTLIDGATTYEIAALSETFTMDSGSTIQINIEANAATETFISGSGTYTPDSTFAVTSNILGDGVEAGSDYGDTYVYTVTKSGDLTLTLDNGTEKLALDDSLEGTRNDTETTTFSFEDKDYTVTDSSATVFRINADIASSTGAAGSIYSGIGTRNSEDGEDISALGGDIVFNNDSYSATSGVIQLTLNEGESTTSLVSGEAAYTAAESETFHFGAYAYTAIEGDATLTINVDYSAEETATLLSATGKGVRDIDSATTFAIAALNSETYTFTSGQAVLTVSGETSTAVEDIYSGEGTYAADGGATATVMFDAANSATGTAYTYTAAEGGATFAITMEDGALATQSITDDGSATRAGTEDDTTFQYEYNGEYQTYSTTSVAEGAGSTDNLTFVLSADNQAIAGAAGTLLYGEGYRSASGMTVTSTFGNEYTLGESDEVKLSALEGETATETLFHVDATKTVAEGDTFMFDGTQYTAVDGDVELNLDITAGNIETQSETGVSGKGQFESYDESDTFVYDGNTYNVDSSTGATLVVDFNEGAQDPEFVAGAGNRTLAVGDNYRYNVDSNTYTMDTEGQAFIRVESGTVVQNLNAGTGTATYNSGDTFNFALDGDMVNYTATDDGATLTITGQTLDNGGATVAFTSGSANRTAEAGDDTTFNYESNTYTATGDVVYTLALDDAGNADESITAGTGTRDLAEEGTFTYTSPTDNNNYTYTAEGDVTLSIELTADGGTETLTQGAGTRALEQGTEFSYTTEKLTTEDVFTATEEGTYRLEAIGSEEMLAMGYNTDAVTETILNVTATTDKSDTFQYQATVVNDVKEYTPVDGAVTFQLNITDGAESVTWLAGSATMTLDAGTEFNYSVDGNEKAYTANEGATFTRFSEDGEYFSSGTAVRDLADGDSATVVFLDKDFVATSGTMLLTAAAEGDTVATEAFDAGEAVFTAAEGEEFNYVVGEDSHTYTATADVTLTVGVAGGKATELTAAEGTGTRGFEDGESATKVLFDADTYEISEGTYQLTLGDIGSESETLLNASGTFTAEAGGEFNVSDAVLGGEGDDVFTYTAGDDGAVLNLTITDGVDKVAIESGLGTRLDDTTNTFVANSHTYTAESDIYYAISAESQTSAAGFVYSAVGTREDEGSGTFVFREDTYTAQSGTMRVVVTEGQADEGMIGGTATYVAAADDTFHYSMTDSEDDIKAYTAINDGATLTATFNEDGVGNLASIEGQGTRYAEDGEEFSTTYQSDTYYAVAGSTTILLDATDSENVFETINGGQVINEVSETGLFHYNPNADDNWYEYTAGNEVTITLDMDNNNEMSFSDDPNATRATEGEDFEFGGQTYSAAESGETIYLLTGSGTALSEAVYGAAGSRNVAEGESYTSTWNNTYALTEGTFEIEVIEGAGTETLTAGAGTATFAAGDTFNYSAEGTSFTANIEGATLGVTIENETDTETLIAGAGFDGDSSYIAVDGAKVTVAGSSNVTLNAVAENAEELVTLTATENDGLTAVANSGEFTADFAQQGKLKANNRDFTAVTEGSLAISAELNSFDATGTFSAEGAFTGDVALSGGSVDIANDDSLAVAFGADGVSSINNLSDNAEVNAVAGATKAVTDEEGTFTFHNDAEQVFVVGEDSEVTFQIDENGVVTGIAGIDKGATFTITDSGEDYEINVDELGKVLTRDENGAWASADVVAEKYLVDVASDNSVVVSAIDSQDDLTQINESVVGSSSVNANGDITFTVNDSVVSEGLPIIVTNKSMDASIALAGAVTVGALASMSSGAAIQIDSDTAATAGAFKTGTLSGNDFVDGNKPYTVTGGEFGIDTEGNITVAAAAEAGNVTVNTAGGDVALGADDTADVFTVNEGPAVTLQVADTDGIGIYAVALTEESVTGLTPSGVDTGTVVIPTDDDVSFAIGTNTVNVAGDDGTMTFEIANDSLVGLNDIATDATISASADATLAINGDTDNTVALAAGDSVKYNTTDDMWLAGDAEAKDATAYLVSVTADGKVELYYEDATQTTPKQTKNKADYAKVFGSDSGLVPDNDGDEAPDYSGFTITDAVSDAAVSVATAFTDAIAITGNRELVLVTADGLYNVNEQELIPSAEVTIGAVESVSAVVGLNDAISVQHGDMTFSADTDTSAIFTYEGISLFDSAKVTNTDADQTFNVAGTVTFDEIVLATTSISGLKVKSTDSTSSGLSIDDEEVLNVMGDAAYTVDTTSDTTLVTGINGNSTVNGSAITNAEIQTASTGTFVINSNAFTIAGDDEVTFQVSDSVVSAISELAGTATGNFGGNGVLVDDKSIRVLGDDSIAVTADGTVVSAIDGVGADDGVTIANSGAAAVINADKNGTFYFGSPGSSYGSKKYEIKDEDGQASFAMATTEINDFSPTVTAVSGISDGYIAIGQDESGLLVDGTALTLGSVANAVTINATSNVITSVDGLEGSINGLASDTAVQVVDDNASINNKTIAISETGGTTVVAVAADGGYNYVTGLNKDAVVNIAQNASILTEEEGAFTFPNGTFTISGDSEVTFVTDGDSKVIDVANFSGTLQTTASETTVNGAAVAMAMGDSDSAVSDVTIASSGSGVDSILGLGDGDSVTAPAGAAVAMDTNSDTATTMSVNGKTFKVEGDPDGVVITPGDPDSINGLAPGASLTAVDTAGTYNVNGTPIKAGVGSVIIGDEEGTSHIYDPSDFNVTEDDSPEDVVNKLTGGTASSDKYVESLDSDGAKALLAEGGSALDGNIELTMEASADDDKQVADFSKSTGSKKATMQGTGEQEVSFNNEGGNIAIVPDDPSGETQGTKDINLGDGGDIVAIGNTGAQVNVKAGKGRDQISTKGRNTKVDVSAGGATRLMANGLGASMEVEGYDHTTGAGIQTTNSDIKAAIRQNTIGLQNGVVTTKGASIRTGDTSAEGASVVNFYNLKGLMTKVGYTHDEGGEVDLSAEKNDVVMKGNYTQSGAQKKSGSSKLVSGSGNDYALGGAGDDIDVGEGNNEILLDGDTRSNADAGATITQSATRGKTEVTGFNAEYGNTGDHLNIAATASVSFVGNVLTFIYGAAKMILNGINAYSSSSDLAESADEDDNATSLNGTTNFAPILIGDSTSAVKTAIASEGDWIGGDTLWAEENMPTAYVGSGEGSGVDFRGFDSNIDMTLSGANANSGGVINGAQGVEFRNINELRLGNGSSTVYGAGDVNNTIVAGLGSSSIWGGGSSDDTFIGRQTSLKAGADTFFYINGDGKDVIKNFEFLASDNASTADKVNVRSEKVTGASVSGSDVLVNLTNDNDRLKIEGAVGQDFIMEYGADGNYDTLVAQVNYDSVTFDNRATYYQAVNKNATVSASSELSEAEIWLNNNRNNTFVGDIQVLNASAVEGRTTLVGNSNDNVIYGSSENSSMWGGDQGGNDTLVGGAGADMFWYGKNNGNDTITSVDGNDVINLYDVNIADVEDYSNWTITNNSVSFNMKDSAGGGSLTIQTNNSGIGFKFADDANTYAINQRDGSYYTK